MELTNDFRVAVSPAATWAVLTDVELIAPCMPGAQLQEIEGDEYRGTVKVKVGPITAQYKGVATFLERDEANLKLVLKAEGRETRGQGNASAIITATMVADGDGTKVHIVTDLTVTGKVAQFGRGVMADVSGKLVGQFVDCLGTKLVEKPVETAAAGEPPAAQEASAPAPAASATPPAAPTVRKIESAEAAPVDLLDAAGAPVFKRVGPVLALVALAWLLRVLLKRRHR